jgi:hypothetical protein
MKEKSNHGFNLSGNGNLNLRCSVWLIIPR